MNLADLHRALRNRPLISQFLRGLLVLILIPVVAGPSSHVANATTQASGDNPIVLENQQPGDSSWSVWTNWGDDVSQQIKGYASATSVKQTDNISFFVTVNPPQPYTIDIYRLGWYAGLGGRLRLHVGPLDGVQQPPC